MQVETLPSGTILHGRYRIERALGSGGFGHVYLSIDLQTNTPYALKEYLVTGANGKAQLEHEAQVLGHLHHPNLPAFLTAFDERGHYYVVLGYIEGSDLTDYVRVVRQKNEVIPLARLMEWLLSICDAVAFLHSQRPPIIHRDIKPDNIRITPGGMAILVDLGNAKTAADGARTLFFIRHQGTPGYAPLEQYPGGTGTDERSDIYALGGTLYFALTAHEPPSVSTRNQSLQQKRSDMLTLQERLAENPPDVPQEVKQFRLGVSKPSRPTPRHSRHLAQLGTLPPELLHKLDAIIQRAMAMRPNERYQSVTDLSNDLKSVLRVLPTSTVPPASGRQVDPHSTQPDLPMLYEAMQNAQAASQDKPAQPVSTPRSFAVRCPRCGTDLNRPAPYCPTCGNPLTSPPNPPKNLADASLASPDRKGAPQASMVQDISKEATLLISPRVPPQSSDGPRPGSPSAQARQPGEAVPALPMVKTAGQAILKTPSQSVPAIQVPVSEPQRPATTGTHTTVKPFLPSASVTPGSQVQMASTPAQPPTTQNRQVSRQRIFISLTIIVVVLILVMLLLLVATRGHGHTLFGGSTRYALLNLHNTGGNR